MIAFRETLEAALVVGIVLAYLVKINQLDYRKFVWWGAALGILASIAGAILFTTLLGGFTGRAEEIFEGTLMFIAAGLLTTVILWMMKQGKYVRQHLEEQVQREITETHAFGLLALVFFAVLREGIETVIFLGAASRVEAMNILWSLFGIIVALLIGWSLFQGVIKLRLGVFFQVTGIILVLFAAGLIAHGIHEFQEAGVLPVIVEHLWDINWLIDERSALGTILKALFGYNGNPSMLEVLGWLTYLGLSFGIYWTTERTR
ncbi:MAG: FTR1 family iron permease [Anaerolineae bacterium]